MAVATGDVIGSLVRQRLRAQRYNQCLKDALGRLTVLENLECSDIIEALTQLEGLFDYRDQSVVEDAVYINNPEMLTDAQAKSSLVTCFNKVFNDGIITWNRVAVVCATVSMLADNALRAGMITRVLQLVCWAEEYFRVRLIDAWICQKCGWTDVVEYAKSRSNDGTKPCGETPQHQPRSPTRPQRSPRPRSAASKHKSKSPYNSRKVAGELRGIAGDIKTNCFPSSRSSRPRSRPKKCKSPHSYIPSPDRLLMPAKNVQPYNDLSEETKLAGGGFDCSPSDGEPSSPIYEPNSNFQGDSQENEEGKSPMMPPSPPMPMSHSDDPLALHGKKLKGIRYCLKA